MERRKIETLYSTKEVAMLPAERKELEDKLSLPSMIFAIEKASANFIFKQREKLHRLLTTKELTALPRGETREAMLSQVLGRSK